MSKENIGRIMLDVMFDNPMEQIDSLLKQAHELSEKYREPNPDTGADREGVTAQ